MIEAIEAQLGHPLAHGSIDDLNQVPDDVVASARTLGRVRATAYLRALVVPGEHRWLTAFIEACVDGTTPVATWGRGRVLYLAPEREGLLTAPLTESLAALAAFGPIRAIRPAPARRQLTGAPAVDLPDVDYRWTIPAGFGAYQWGHADTDPVTDPVLAARRWLVTLFHQRTIPPADPATVLERLAPGLPPSDDAKIALRAFLRLRPEHPDAPALGIFGPDEWYREA